MSNNNPPAGDLTGGYWGSLAVEPNLGREEVIRLNLLVVFPPFTKIPVFQCKTQLFTTVQVEFIEDTLQMRLDGLGGNGQCFGDFMVSVTKAD